MSIQPKNIIICADGTWNAVVKKDPKSGQPISTNVARLASVLDRADHTGRPQLLHYMQGVGTVEGESIEGGAFGLGLSENIVRAYEFIVKHYNDGDRIYLFGFSRGAFTVRSLGGMIRTAGIVRRESPATVSDAMALYADKQFERDPDLPRAVIFRNMHSHPPGDRLNCPPIECIGVWDTVGSMGIPTITPRLQKFLGASWSFHDVSLGYHVKHAFHALAINERRSTFVPTLWLKCSTNVWQNLVQCWFAGAHSDVGGGYALAEPDKTLLSDLALHWMIEMVDGTLEQGPGAHGPSDNYKGLPKSTALKFVTDWQKALGMQTLTAKLTPHDSSGGIWKFIDWLMKKPGGHVRGFNREAINNKNALLDQAKKDKTAPRDQSEESKDFTWESCEYTHSSVTECCAHNKAAIDAGTLKWDPSFRPDPPPAAIPHG